MLLRCDIVRGDEHVLDFLRHLVEVDVALVGDAAHQVLGIPAPLLGHAHELGVHVRHQHAGLVPHEGHGEQGLDPTGAACDDRDGAGRRHGRQVAVTQPAHRTNAHPALVPGGRLVGPPDRLLPLREDAALGGQALRLDLRFLVDESHELLAELNRAGGAVGLTEPNQHVGPTHDPEADAPDVLRKLVDRRKRVLVGVDHVVEKMRGLVDGRPQAIPVDPLILDKGADVDRAQIAHVVRQQGLLTARVRGLVRAHVRHRVVPVGLVDEEDARLAVPPRPVDDLVEHFARVQLSHRLSTARVLKVVRRAAGQRRHELFRDGHGDVEVRDLVLVFLAVDESEDVGVIDPQDPHVGAPPRAALLHRFGRGVIHLHEAHRPARDAHRGLHHVAARPQAAESEARAAARLMDQSHVAKGLVDPVQRVRDREDEARAQLPEGTSCIHQSGAVRLELADRHHFVELARRFHHVRGRGTVLRVDRGDDPGYPPEHVGRGLDRLEILVLLQVALGQNRVGVLGQPGFWQIRRRRFEVHGLSLDVMVCTDRGVRSVHQGASCLVSGSGLSFVTCIFYPGPGARWSIPALRPACRLCFRGDDSPEGDEHPKDTTPVDVESFFADRAGQARSS